MYVLVDCYYEDLQFLVYLFFFLEFFNNLSLFFSSLSFTGPQPILAKEINSNTYDNNTKLADFFIKISDEMLNKRKLELEWLSGFVEAEGMFYVSTSGVLSFKIKLHWDDRETLKYIQDLLSELANRKVGVIIDSKDLHESYYSVSKFKDLYEIIIPIFSKYCFSTSKYFDFIDFKKVSEKKIKSFVDKRKLNEDELNEILIIKSNMNSQRLQFNIDDIPKRVLTPYRVLGFVEGDGTFCLSNMSPLFAIKQHTKNIHFLYEIAKFLNNLPYNPEIGPNIDKLNTKPTAGISPAGNNTSSLNVANVLQLYNYVLPFFKSLEFRSRKLIDFQLWELAVKLKVLGFSTQPEGKTFLIEINKYINKRYSTRDFIEKSPDIIKIKELLNNPPIYDLSSGLSYKALSDIVKVLKKGHLGFGVNVYDKGKLIEGSPFKSYTQAALALGNINISSVISKKIDTGKLYKERYLFESSS